MFRKLMVSLLSMFFIACGVLAIVFTVYFVMPSAKAKNSISLPSKVEDSASSVSQEATTEHTGYDNIYLADVHQSLTLRTEPNSDSSPVMEEGLAPMTHMQVLEFIDGTGFARVEVINGTYKGRTGYVNCDYITKLGEPTIRVGAEE